MDENETRKGMAPSPGQEIPKEAGPIVTEEELGTLPEDSMEYQAYKQVQTGELNLPHQVYNLFSGKIRYDEAKNQGKRTGDTVSVTQSTKNAWETQIAAVIAEQLEMEGKWVKATSLSVVCDSAAGKAIKILRKDNDVILIEHATAETGYGIFNNVNGVEKLSKVLKSKGEPIRSVGLLGCEVTGQFAQQLATMLGVEVYTLPTMEGSRLHIDAHGYFHYGIVSDFRIPGPHPTFQFLNNDMKQYKYMAVLKSGTAKDLPNTMNQIYNP